MTIHTATMMLSAVPLVLLVVVWNGRPEPVAEALLIGPCVTREPQKRLLIGLCVVRVPQRRLLIGLCVAHVPQKRLLIGLCVAHVPQKRLLIGLCVARVPQRRLVIGQLPGLRRLLAALAGTLHLLAHVLCYHEG
ncbi:hypothetical protein FJT64_007447 [Amphibalanus amphitrite]|uniref:Secreted protein n=1 Tax=Amphibalanus amphitrite TaxID=1232801 RepID=A0A6A4VET0_AMPAM|nr:hypothetical protein FJT64_007447 [Amphibalanus amphitrite]